MSLHMKGSHTPTARADLWSAPCLIEAHRRLYAAQKLLCASELGLSCPSSGRRHLTHAAVLSARFQSVVSKRHLRRNVRFRSDFVCFNPDSGPPRALTG